MDTTLTVWAEGLPVFWLGTLASLCAGLMTGVGALPALFGRRVSSGTQNSMLGFAAGVMLAATAFSLVLPGLEQGLTIYGSAAGASLASAAGILVGGAGIALLHRYAPHEHFITGREGADHIQLRRLWLFVIAITLHNFPEGLAVGVAFGGGNMADGMALTAGIGLQNVPEGLAVALALLAVGYSQLKAVAIAAATGLVEVVGGMAGAGLVSIALPVLPVALAFAAGAMLFVISNEIIPETHRKGSAATATAGLMVGFVVMLQLDVLLA
ncbi:MAG: ZIP family metal transporter [Alphaproteobacteria bacterium]|nr:ZIP family metal transporter [Alphaproteobacteria bacterium]